MTEIVDFTYDELANDCKILAEKIIKSNRKFKMIVAITRGGLFPALALSHLLQIKDIECLALESYASGVNAENSEIKVCNTIEKVIPNRNDVLFVDDLFDSGNTMKFVKNRYPDAERCVLYLKDKNNQANLDCLSFYGKLVENKWLRFPYEVD